MAAPADARTVLVVNDTDPVLAFYLELLADEGPRPVARSQPLDPGDVLAPRPDLVLLDLFLGHEGAGWRFLRALKADPRTAGIPVVIVSAVPGWVTVLDRQHAAAVLPKPTRPWELLAAVEHAVAGHATPE